MLRPADFTDEGAAPMTALRLNLCLLGPRGSTAQYGFES
jgi:hypothetical protein